MWAAMDQTMLGIAHRWEAGEVLELVGIYEPILRAHRETCATCPQPYGQGPAEDDGSSDINDEEFPRDENAEVAEATGEQIQ